MSDIRTFEQIGPGDAKSVGGKALSLAALTAAGLPVPPGFCVTSAAHARLRGSPLPGPFRQELSGAYQRLGAGLVAVRSSAASEDGEAASFAGQQETILGVNGDVEVCAAVERCWASLDSERARAYRERQGVAEAAMAVVIQRLVDAEAAGVMFTRDPMDPASERMIVEASWGLGETVVSGRVTPDHFIVNRSTGDVIERQLGQKTVERTAAGERAVAPERQSQFCLTDAQLAELAELGRKVEAQFGQPRDVEWAWAGGQAWLLQARPITTAGVGEREKIRQEEIAALRVKAAPGGTVWGRFNLSEVLAEPTPMTWDIVRYFMSGRGGYGRMFADLGFPPDPALADECGYDLICGRPYMNLSREPRMQWADLPVRHDFAKLKAEPAKVPYSVAEFRPERASFGTKLRAMWRIVRGGWTYQRVAAKFAREFRAKTIPQFVAKTTTAMEEHWSANEPSVLLQELDDWIAMTLVGFARDSLKPTALAAGSLAILQKLLEKPLGRERYDSAVAELTVGVRPDADADLAGALKELAQGRLDRATFVEKFGHRGSREMELAAPRWSEDPRALDQVLASADAAGHMESDSGAIARVAAEAKLSAAQKSLLKTDVAKLRDALALRETGKHYLMRGYALIRRALVELDQRFGLAGGIFFLTRDELPRLIRGEDLTATITERRKRRAIALSIEVPPVIFSDDPEAIGRPLPPLQGATLLQGVALSPGFAEGLAMVLTDPAAAAPAMSDYVLVCPSTDPSWVPLFARAKALIMETGGVLSHGAIVAREFGLPAVAGLPDIVRRLHTGQRVQVDGNRGTVAISDT